MTREGGKKYIYLTISIYKKYNNIFLGCRREEKKEEKLFEIACQISCLKNFFGGYLLCNKQLGLSKCVEFLSFL